MTSPTQQDSQDDDSYTCPRCGRELIAGTLTSHAEPATGEGSSPASVSYYLACTRGHYTGPARGTLVEAMKASKESR